MRTLSWKHSWKPARVVFRRCRPELEQLEARTLLAAGVLDPTFGSGGIVTTDFPGILDVGAAAVLLQPDGKLVTVGTTDSPGDSGNFALTRYNPNGTVDGTFGTGGLVVTDFENGAAHATGGVVFQATGAVLQPDGKIVVAGTANNDIALARYQANGSLDPTFGTGGEVTTDLANGQGSNGQALLLQPDGKLVVAGSADILSPTTLALARYNADGSLDVTFGTGGKVTTPFAAGESQARAVALQADGKLVVAGETSSENPNVLLARYNANGSLDSTFGTGGQVTTPSTGTFAGVNAVAVQGNGQIVVAADDANGFALFRYNANGSRDTTFGSGGLARASLSSANAVAVLPNGKLLAAGDSGVAFNNEDFGLARFNPDGSLDTTFGSGGLADAPFAGTATTSVAALAVQSDGRIVLAGASGTTSEQSPFVFHGAIALARYTPDGHLDASFGSGGQVTNSPLVPGANNSAASVAVQPDGKVVVVGTVDRLDFGDFAVARYSADGSLDATFGTGGRVTTDFSGRMDAATAVAVQPDGKIVVVGSSALNGTSTFQQNLALARYNSDGSLDASFGTGGKVLTTVAAMVIPDALALQADGKIVVGVSSGYGSPSLFLARYNADGSLDATFGQSGQVVSSLGPAASLAVQPDGEVVVATMTFSTTARGFVTLANLELARFNPDGSADTTFGSNGQAAGGYVAEVPGPVSSPSFYQPGSLYRLARQPDGKLVVAAFPPVDFNGNPVPAALLRYNADGSPDTTFGQNGQVTLSLSGASGGLAIEADGHIVVAGGTVSVASYNPDGSLDTAFGTGGQTTTSFGGSNESVAGLALEPDGKIVVAGSTTTAASTTDFALARFTTEHFVDHLYLDLLGRPADDAGRAYWNGLLQQGTQPAAVAAGILGSLEHRLDTVRQLFVAFLHRPADPFGLGVFSTFLGQGGTPEQVVAAIVSSPEYAQQHAGTDAGFLAGLYQDALGRAPDPTGQAVFGTALAAGASRTEVAAAVFGSVEYQQDLVQGWYHTFLHRPADPTGLAALTGALAGGQTDAGILALILGSDENRAGTGD